MKLHRFIGDFNLNTQFLIVSDKAIFNQIKKVLKLKVGEKIILGDGKLNEGLAKILEFKKDVIKVEILGVKQNKNEPAVCVILYCSLLKRENFEMVVQKATEVGVAEIIPIIAERTVKLNLKEDRLKKIIREATEQAGRGIVPNLGVPREFAKAMDDARDNDDNIFFDITGQPFTKDLKIEHRGKVGVFIGPEGGWDEQEIKMAQAKNFQIVSLGTLTLRAETAAIVASYLIASSKN